MRGRVILSRLLCEGKLWFSMFHANLKDSDEGRDVSCIAMVTSLEGETCPVGLGLVAKFSEELFMSRNQGETFAATQTEATEEVMTNTDKYVNLALLYLYRKAADEVKEFNSHTVVEKIGVEVDGVLLSKGRIISEMHSTGRLVQTAQGVPLRERGIWRQPLDLFMTINLPLLHLSGFVRWIY